MKKKILFCLLVMVGVLTITGCGKSNESNTNTKQEVSKEKNVVTIEGEKYKLDSSDNLYSLHFKENYVDFHTDTIGNYKIMNYINGDLVFEVRMMYDDSRSDSELKAIVETQTGAKEQSKEINGIKYIYYEYTSDEGDTVHHYMYVYDGKVYSIGFFLGKNPGNIEEVFMNNISFE